VEDGIGDVCVGVRRRRTLPPSSSSSKHEQLRCAVHPLRGARDVYQHSVKWTTTSLKGVTKSCENLGNDWLVNGTLDTF